MIRGGSMEGQGKHLRKLEREYAQAETNIRAHLATLFPAGTPVRLNLNGTTGKVIKGSLYPDMVNTTFGHYSARYLERITE